MQKYPSCSPLFYEYHFFADSIQAPRAVVFHQIARWLDVRSLMLPQQLVELFLHTKLHLVSYTRGVVGLVRTG